MQLTGIEDVQCQQESRWAQYQGIMGTDQAMKKEPCIHQLYITIAECTQLGPSQPEHPPKHQ